MDHRIKFLMHGVTAKFTWQFLKRYLKNTGEAGEVIAEQFPSIDLKQILDLVTIEAELYQTQELPKPVSTDPDDDKFLACAIASGSRIIVGGDKHLLKVSGYQGIEILKMHEFIKRHLQMI